MSPIFTKPFIYAEFPPFTVVRSSLNARGCRPSWHQCWHQLQHFSRRRPEVRAVQAVHHSGIEGSGFKSLEEGERVTYELTRGRKGMQAVSVSKALDRRSVGRETLTIPEDVNEAARILVEHFDPDDLYWAMVDAARGRE